MPWMGLRRSRRVEEDAWSVGHRCALCVGWQVAQVLLTLPYSFSQLGMASGVVFQLFYGLMGSWTAYLISVLYVEYRTRKEREKVDFRNHVIQVLFLFRFILFPS